MTEPDVALTDYGLAIECALFAWLLSIDATRHGQLRRRMVLFFAAAAVAPLAGGTVHGFLLESEGALHSVLWVSALLAIGLTALFAWAIGAEIILQPRHARLVERVARFTFVANAMVVIFVHDAFWVAIAFYLPAALFLLLAFLLRVLKDRLPGAGLGAWGVALGILAAALQQLRVTIHPTYFNHNAVYHLVQAVAFVFLFAGMRRLLGANGGSHADAT